jgi:hypothetical protein
MGIPLGIEKDILLADEMLLKLATRGQALGKYRLR